MTASFTLRFRKQYQRLPSERQAKFDKQLLPFSRTYDIHPLRAKQYDDETNDIWQACVDNNYGFASGFEDDNSCCCPHFPSQVTLLIVNQLSTTEHFNCQWSCALSDRIVEVNPDSVGKLVDNALGLWEQAGIGRFRIIQQAVLHSGE